MEPLSITTSIAGLLKASDTVLARLDPILKSRRGAEKIISPLHSELVGSKAVLAALQVLTQAVGSSRPQRLRMVAVDDLLAILTAGVLTFSELEAGISALAISEGETGVAATIQWLWRKREFEIFLSRVISFKESIRLLVTILIGETELEAKECQGALVSRAATLVRGSDDLADRLKRLVDYFRAVDRGFVHTPKDQRQTASIPGECDEPVGSSIFSGVTLADVSDACVVAIPVYASDVTNCQHYSFGHPRLGDFVVVSTEGSKSRAILGPVRHRKTQSMVASSTSRPKWPGPASITKYQNLLKKSQAEMIAILDCEMTGFKNLRVDQARTGTSESSEKTTILKDSHLRELAVDVLDELVRRKMVADGYEGVPESMPETDGMLEQRNAARKKMAALPESKFVETLADMYTELQRRAWA